MSKCGTFSTRQENGVMLKPRELNGRVLLGLAHSNMVWVFRTKTKNAHVRLNFKHTHTRSWTEKPLLERQILS